ncbi:MAG: hypothetical protein AAB534_03320 [Patescibacteria group bacterium]
MIFKNKKLLASSVIVVLALSFAIFYISYGQSGNIFGGRVTFSGYCACTNNFIMNISGPVGGQFVFPLGSSQFPYYRLPSTGVWALGVYSPGGICLVPCHSGCCPFGLPIGTITPIVGTSL